MNISYELLELYIVIVIGIVLIYLIFSKKKQKEEFLYMGIHNYHKNSYKYGHNGLGAKRNPWNFSNLKFSDFIPFLNHIIL